MRRSVVGSAALGLGLVLTLAACGGGGKGSTAAPPVTTVPTTVAPVTEAPTTTIAVIPLVTPDQKAIGTTWTTFFSSKSSAAAQQALLQNGTTYTSQLAKLRKLMSGNVTARVDSAIVSGSTGHVTYDILSNGTALLSGSTGTAVKIGGKWLVSSGTFCGLATLAGAACNG